LGYNKYVAIIIKKAGISTLVFFAGILFASSFAVAQEQKTVNPNIIPTIVIAPDTYYPLEKETLYIEGKAIANAVVDILIQQPGSKPTRFNVQADQNGDWVLTEKPKLDSGEWEVRARIEYEDGTTSRWSNPRIIKSVWNAFQVFGITIKYVWLVILFLIILAVSLVFFIRFLIKNRREGEPAYSHEIEAHLQREEMQHEKLERTLAEKLQEMKQEAAQKKAEETVSQVTSKVEELQRELEIQKKLSEIEAQKKVIPEPIQYSPITPPTPAAVSKEEQETIKKEFEEKMRDIEEAEITRKRALAQEIEEAKKLVSEGFTELRKDFQDQLKILEERSKYQPPSAQDMERKNQILAEMLSIEKQIQELKETSSRTFLELEKMKKNLETQLSGGGAIISP